MYIYTYIYIRWFLIPWVNNSKINSKYLQIWQSLHWLICLKN